MLDHRQPPAVTRQQIAEVARAWLGTPYRHQASVQGVGCDCLGLVRGVYRALYGAEPEIPPAYTRDWAEASGAETLIAAASRHLEGISPDTADCGDVVIFRYRSVLPAKHCGVLTGRTTMIHAVEGVPVAEVAIGSWWRRRIAAAFAFPGRRD